MTSFITISSPSLLYPTRPSVLPSPSPRSVIPITQFKKGFCWDWRLKCVSSGSSPDAESHSETTNSTSSSSSSFSSAPISTYNWCAALGGIGFLETVYLTYLKLSNSNAFCPIGGSSCGDVLNSGYAVVFGVPLPAIGIVAYGLVAHSVYSCLGRIYLSELASLFFITLKEFGLQEIQKVLGLQLCIASLVIVALSASYGNSPLVTASSAEIDLPYVTYEITAPSSPFALSLAKQLKSIGAKMYGAFWCSHCLEQKQMFGKEASQVLDYIECFPDGYRKGTKMAKACADARIEGFPTWVINDQILSGEQELTELAQISGLEFSESSRPT